MARQPFLADKDHIRAALSGSAASLPVAAILDQLCETLARDRAAVLEAPPGAGKTTLVPLALAADPAFDGRILMLEPRRLAARGAAAYMARLLGEDGPGKTIGFRVRGESQVSKATRVEVVTEGILTRMVQSNPELPGIAAVIFDEFHERSLNADLGLALTLDARAAFRPDLAVLVMSATLDGGPVAQLLGDVQIIRAQGRAYPVTTRHLPAPRKQGTGPRRIGDETGALVLQAMADTPGSVLAFLPGEREIRQAQTWLAKKLPDDATLHTLYGAMPLAAQQAAIRPAPTGTRKVVLATAIAETSLTIEDIRIVVDSGLARRARFDPGSGLSRLVTERVTRAEAEQRRGRAGRVAPGVAWRNWAQVEEGALAAFAPAEIETADLTPLALELASWGAADGAGLAFLTPPPAGPLAKARALLRDLGGLDDNGRITPLGTKMAALPMHPRLAAMVARAGPGAGLAAATLGDRDPLTGQSRPTDFTLRLQAVANPKGFATRRGIAVDQAACQRIRAEAKRLGWRDDMGAGVDNAGRWLALAYPDRIGMRRAGEAPRFLLSGGRGAHLDPGDALAGDRFIIAVDLDGASADARIRLAVPIARTDLEDAFADRIKTRHRCIWSRRNRSAQAVQERHLGALILQQAPWKECPPETRAAAYLEGVRDLGLDCLNWPAGARRLQARVEWLRARGGDMADCSDAGLLAAIEDWLLPVALQTATFEALCKADLVVPLQARVGWQAMTVLHRMAPPAFTAPTGTQAPIDYAAEPPEIEIRLQEMLGLARHPTVGPDHLALKVTLLSPARRPLQTTTDLPGFWASSYADVRKDMRGRYPKHPWPVDPLEAQATRRAKPRK